jgi:hypothetical protein
MDNGAREIEQNLGFKRRFKIVSNGSRLRFRHSGAYRNPGLLESVRRTTWMPAFVGMTNFTSPDQDERLSTLMSLSGKAVANLFTTAQALSRPTGGKFQPIPFHD